MNITVYCGAFVGDNPHYEEEARKLGTWIGTAGHTLVWGAGGTGLMGAVSRAAQESHAQLHGVIPDFLKTVEQVLPGTYELDVYETMAERRLRMIELGDAFVALPGGPGTLEELSEVFSLIKLDKLDAPLILMNVDGYYDALLRAIDTMVEHKFLLPEIRARLFAAEDAAGVIQLLHRTRRGCAYC